MIRVTHFTRKHGSGAFSMEGVYAEVRRMLPSDVKADVWECRHDSKGVLGRLADVWGASRCQNDVNHVTGDVHYITYLMKKTRTILTVHDCVSIDRSGGLKRFLLWLFWYWLPEKCSGTIVVISEATKNQFLRHVRCDPAKVVVIHNPVKSSFVPVPKTKLPERPTLLVVGTSEHKNIERMVEAARGLKVRWVVVGRLSHQQRAAFEKSGAEYENLMNLSQGELVQKYIDCDIVMFASTYEGFGLPIVEAQAVGRPVLTSNLWSMPEVAGDGACIVDPFDVSSIRTGLKRILEDHDYRRAMVDAGFANVRRFTSGHIAQAYAELYRRVAGGEKPGAAR